MTKNDPRPDRNPDSELVRGASPGAPVLHSRTNKNNPGKHSGILDWFFDFFVTPIVNTLKNLVKDYGDVFRLLVPITWVNDLVKQAAPAAATVDETLAPDKITSPEQAAAAAPNLTKTLDKNLEDLVTTLMGVEAASAGMLDITPNRAAELPPLKFLSTISTALRETRFTSGFLPYYQRHVLKQYTPLLPPTADLIQMVVREAFLPEMVVTAPDVFSDYMMESGYAPEWSDRYWTAHFVPIDLRQAYENLWRGFWTKDDFMFALHIADIHPRWREDIYKVAFRPPSMREMGYGWDMGVYTEEDIATYRRWGGLSPEDADKAARAMVAYRLHAEQETLRSLAVRLYREGLDGPEEFEANLEAAQTPEILRPYWRARAELEAELDIAADYTVILRSAALAGRITRETLARELGQIGLKQWKINQILADVDFRRSISVEAVRALTPTQILRAYQAGIRPRAWAEERLVKLNYSDEDVSVLLALYKPGGETAG